MRTCNAHITVGAQGFAGLRARCQRHPVLARSAAVLGANRSETMVIIARRPFIVPIGRMAALFGSWALQSLRQATTGLGEAYLFCEHSDSLA